MRKATRIIGGWEGVEGRLSISQLLSLAIEVKTCSDGVRAHQKLHQITVPAEFRNGLLFSLSVRENEEDTLVRTGLVDTLDPEWDEVSKETVNLFL